MSSKLKYIKDFIFIQKCIPWRVAKFWGIQAEKWNKFWGIQAEKWVKFWGLKAKKWTETEYIEDWRIAIYKMTLRDNALRLINYNANNNPVLSNKDIKNMIVEYVADPFLVFHNGSYNIFFEALKNMNGVKKGIIGLAASKDLKKWKFKKIVLEEPFHLSYPNIFSWEGKYYMTPESFQEKSVRLYEAVKFPGKWRFVKNLLEGRNFVDPTFFHYKNKCWMFLSDSSNCILYLYHSDSLKGDWKEHPKSPIIKDNFSKARPAGSVLFIKNRLIRVSQDYFKSYGYAVRAFEITKLDTREYEERELSESPLIKATGSGWNSDGMHHLSACLLGENEWAASVDGKKVYERYKHLRHCPRFLTRLLVRIAQNS